MDATPDDIVGHPIYVLVQCIRLWGAVPGAATDCQKRLGTSDSPEYNRSMDRDVLLTHVKQAVAEVEPEAQVILHGSRARGEWGAESDWDFLILIDGLATDERVDRIRHRLYEIEWESGQVLSSIVRSRDEWGSQPLNTTPFYRNVRREGIVL